jgi:hypothetical protein
MTTQPSLLTPKTVEIRLGGQQYIVSEPSVRMLRRCLDMLVSATPRGFTAESDVADIERPMALITSMEDVLYALCPSLCDRKAEFDRPETALSDTEISEAFNVVAEEFIAPFVESRGGKAQQRPSAITN